MRRFGWKSTPAEQVPTFGVAPAVHTENHERQERGGNTRDHHF